VGQDTAVAEQVVADDAVGWRLAVDEEGVAAEIADNAGGEGLASAENEEPVVALGTAHLDLLDIDEADVEAGAKNAVLGDHEIVAELGADHDHGVEAVAAVDGDGGVDRVGDEVGVGAAADVGALAQVLLGTDEGKCLDQETVVTALPVGREYRLVVEDDELVLAVTGIDRQVDADAVAEEAAGGLDRGVHVLGRDAGLRSRALRLVELADLEEVVAVAGVDRDRRAGVIEVELVVAELAEDVDGLEAGIVVDTLETRVLIQQRHEGEPALRRRRPQQEQVVLVRALDVEYVGADTAGVEDMDQRVGGAADQADVVGVAVATAVECHLGVYTIRRKGGERIDIEVELDGVVLAAALEEHVLVDGLDQQHVRAAAAGDRQWRHACL
jgi:hypothetical protein